MSFTFPLLAIVLSNSYPSPACPAAHAVPALVLDVALSEVAEDRDRCSCSFCGSCGCALLLSEYPSAAVLFKLWILYREGV